MQTSLLFQIEFFLTSILIFPGKVKPSGRISHPKRRKHSIFVFIEKHSSKILRVDAAGNGCKIHAHGVRLQSRFTEILNPFYTLANFFVFSIDILCTWTVISYGTDCDRAVAQHHVCGYDYAILQALHNLAEAAGGFFTPLCRAITLLGEKGILFLVLGIVLMLFPKTRKAGICMFGAVCCGALITNFWLKDFVARRVR